MTTIIYKGKYVNLVNQFDYNIEIAIHGVYEGLILNDDGSLEECFVDITMSNNTYSASSYVSIPNAAATIKKIRVYDVELEAEAKEKLASKIPSVVGKANWFYGLGALAVENTPGTFRLTNGAYNGNLFSPKYYRSGWTGGSVARIKTFNFMKVGKTLGKISIGIGTALDLGGVGVYMWDSGSPYAVHPLKAGSNFIINIYGIYNPAFSVPYYLIDGFYPGGWSQALEDRDRMEKENQKIVPGFKLTPKPAW